MKSMSRMFTAAWYSFRFRYTFRFSDVSARNFSSSFFSASPFRCFSTILFLLIEHYS